MTSSESPEYTPSPLVWLRSCIFYLLLIISIPPTAMVLFLLKKSSIETRLVYIQRFSRFVNFMLSWIGGIRVHQVGDFPSDSEPTLIIANHTGPWETLGLIKHVPRFLSYVLKQDLLRWHYNFFALGLSALEPIPITRATNAGDWKTMVMETPKRFAKGCWVLVFPQGTRAPVADALNMGSGGVLLAKKMKCRIVPLFINSEAWSRGHWIKDFGLVFPGTIHLHVGTPIPAESVKQAKTGATHQQIIQFFDDCMKAGQTTPTP